MGLEKLPRHLLLDCPACGGSEQRHQVLKGKVTTRGEGFTLDALVRCGDCGDVRRETVRRPEPVQCRLIISDGADSRPLTITLDHDEVLQVDDTIMVEELPVKISSIESGGRRVSRAEGGQVHSLWGVRYDRVVVKVSIVKGRETTSERLEAAPDQEFKVGEFIKVKAREYRLEKIKVAAGVLEEGSAPASEIRRLYLKPPPGRGNFRHGAVDGRGRGDRRGGWGRERDGRWGRERGGGDGRGPRRSSRPGPRQGK